MIHVTKVTYVAFALHDGKPVHYSMCKYMYSD